MENNKMLLEKMRSIFNAIDPVGIYFDDNKDEYDPEIRKVMSSLPQLRKIDDFQAEVKHVFASMFEGVQIEKSKLDALAQKLFEEFAPQV